MAINPDNVKWGITMKILWLCNNLIVDIANDIGVKQSSSGGWMSGIYGKILNSSNDDVVYLYPAKQPYEKKISERVTVIGFEEKNPEKFDRNQIPMFIDIIKRHKPDIIHIWGTEFPHSYAMVLVAEKTNCLNKVVINLQGMISLIAQHYYAYMPNKAIHSYTLRDFFKRRNIYHSKINFENRGKYEENTLKKVQYAIGRTEFDYVGAKRINPNIKYYICNETLRDIFYDDSTKWNIDEIEQYSIFVSQASYPVKGFHLMLHAMKDILTEFPTAHLYVTGNDPLEHKGIKKLKETSYQKYIGRLIQQKGLRQYVSYVGQLDAKDMKERFIKTHVFVCCSSIENESNSISEARILGTPVVSSYVGGVISRIEHGHDGLLYQADAPYMLAHRIKQVFSDHELAQKISKNGCEKAKTINDPDINYITLRNIYTEINNATKNNGWSN